VVHKLIEAFYEKPFGDIEEFVDLSFERPGQDVRYSVDDSKLQALGWQPKKLFNKELERIVKSMKEDFRW
jgi:dTDP-glucose 4,6-dehydratase